MSEFTGERVIPGQVDVDLLNEHFARYAFAARLARGKRVLDAGCGAGYGSAELAATAEAVTGLDCAPEAIEFARANYNRPNLSFQEGSCEALPFPDDEFELVAAFEVIEHLTDWRGFLQEARRVLAPREQLVVSTPNRLYYTESRGAEGANPFHVHEFEFAEFRAELQAVFPHVTMFLENHVEGVAFQPHEAGSTTELRVDSGESAVDDSHFFVAVCAYRPQVGNPTFVYVPRAANLLREREKHIRLLEAELVTKNQWLEKALDEQQKLMSEFAAQKTALEKSNKWAEAQDREIQISHERVVELQEELEREQAAAVETAARYESQVVAIERDLNERTRWAQDLTAEVQKQTADLGAAVDALHQTEKELEDRTAWALRLQKDADYMTQQLALIRGSRWVKLGRKIGLGPELPPA